MPNHVSPYEFFCWVCAGFAFGLGWSIAARIVSMFHA